MMNLLMEGKCHCRWQVGSQWIMLNILQTLQLELMVHSFICFLAFVFIFSIERFWLHFPSASLLFPSSAKYTWHVNKFCFWTWEGHFMNNCGANYKNITLKLQTKTTPFLWIGMDMNQCKGCYFCCYKF